MFWIKFLYLRKPKPMIFKTGISFNYVLKFVSLKFINVSPMTLYAMAVVVSSCNCVSYPTKAVKARIETH